MTANYNELIKLLKLNRIKITESHEVSTVTETPRCNVNIEMQQGISNDSPHIDEDRLSFQMKYVFNFSAEEHENFFSAEYVLFIVFGSSDINRVKELLADNEINDTFVNRQLPKIIWPIIRATLLDAFNKHSLTPIPLPLMA